MKFFIINTNYPDFIDKCHEENPALCMESFEWQLEARYETLFGMANYYSENLKKLGQEAIDIIVNDPHIQKKWAEEHDLKYSEGHFQRVPKIRRWFAPDWVEKILAAQITDFKPDVILNMAMETVGSKFFNNLRKKTKFKLIGQHASPVKSSMDDLSAYDLILSSLPNYVKYFKEKGARSEYFKLGFGGEIILNKLVKKDKQNDVIFVGGIGRHHSEGTKMFELVAERVPTFKIWGYGIENIPQNSPLKKCFQGGALYGTEMYQELYNSKIAINRHIDIAGNFANNMRLYETTGVGTMLITDHKENISELFEVGKEIETYKTKEELVEKIKYYLSHEDERKKIAEAGQKRTLKNHTYKNRMEELLSITSKLKNEND